MILAYHYTRSSIYEDISAFSSMFIIVNSRDRHSFCRNYSKVYSQKLGSAVRTTKCTFFFLFFVFCYIGFCIRLRANKATRAYLIQFGHKLRGRPTTTLPIVLNRDLGLIDHFRLQSTDDLVKITELARDREQWRELSARIEKAAEASQTMNWDATRQ